MPPGFHRSPSPSPWTGRRFSCFYDAIHGILGTALKEAGGKAPNELKDTKRSHMRVHGRSGEACPVCGDKVREVSFADTALQYCPTCQTKGKILADRRTSRFLK